MDNTLSWMSAHELRDSIVAHEFSAVEVTEHFVSRSLQLDPGLHAFITLAGETALLEAAEVDRQLADRTNLGPLAGVPVTIKDSIDVAGLRQTSGSLVYKDHVSAHDAVVVERLRGAGAVILGKTSMPELGQWWQGWNRLGPECRNPWDTQRTSGGSSSGAAASVAAGMAPIGVGTDGGGSIRIPAALCGVTGLKPGAGLVPTSGKGASRFSVVGPIAREVRDLALLLQVLAGPDPRDIYALEAQPPNYLDKLEHVPSGVRAAWWWEEPTETTSNPEAVALAREAAHAFVNFGVTVDEPNFGLDVSRLKVPHRLASWADLWNQEGEILYENLGHRGLLSSYLLETLRVGKAITGGEIAQALRIRDQFIHDLRAVFSAYDLLLAPTVADVAGSIEDKSFGACWAATHFTFPANFGGFAAATVPCGFVDGLPVGLQIIGPSGAEPLILRACRAFEMERPWAHVHPIITSSPG